MTAGDDRLVFAVGIFLSRHRCRHTEFE
jgi:hypothetical protein